MGCDASEPIQPHKKIVKVILNPVKQKRLFQGFCFGSKSIRIYEKASCSYKNNIGTIE